MKETFISSPLVGEDKGGGLNPCSNITPILAFPHKGGRKNLFAAILLLIVSSISLFAAETPTYGKVPEFSFVNQDGKIIMDSDLKGKVWIANFIFTRCQGMCPLLTGRMAAVQEKLKSTDIQLISFSVDPEYDTPEILSQYAAFYKAAPGKWFFLTTDKNEKMWEFITKGFMLGAGEASAEDRANGAEPVMHSSRFVLVDREGNIRGYYDSQEKEKMDQLINDAMTLSKGR